MRSIGPRKSFGALIEYAKPFGINIVIENHGGISSDPRWLPDLMRKVDSPHFGTLPDYGNFAEGADVYEAVRLAMPFAKGVSVKAGFEPDGSHPQYSLEKLLKISKDSGIHRILGHRVGHPARPQRPSQLAFRHHEGRLAGRPVDEGRHRQGCL